MHFLETGWPSSLSMRFKVFVLNKYTNLISVDCRKYLLFSRTRPLRPKKMKENLRLNYNSELWDACGEACRSRQCFLSLPLVHLLNLYPCALLLFSSWLLSYCHPCTRIAARRNDRNREISGKAIIANSSAGIKLWVWVHGAGITLQAIKPNLHYWLIRIYRCQSLPRWPPPQMNGI